MKIFDTTGFLKGAYPVSWDSTDFLPPDWDVPPNDWQTHQREFTEETAEKYRQKHPADKVPSVDMEGEGRLGKTSHDHAAAWLQALKLARKVVGGEDPILYYGLPMIPNELAQQHFSHHIDPVHENSLEIWVSRYSQHIKESRCVCVGGYLWNPRESDMVPNLKAITADIRRAQTLLTNKAIFGRWPLYVWVWGHYVDSAAEHAVVPMATVDRLLTTVLASGADGFIYWDNPAVGDSPTPLRDRLAELI